MGVKEQEILTTYQLWKGGSSHPKRVFTSEHATSMNRYGVEIAGDLSIDQFKLQKRKTPPESIHIFRNAVETQYPPGILTYLTAILERARSRIEKMEDIQPTFAYLRENPDLLYAILPSQEAAAIIQTFKKDPPEKGKEYRLSNFLENVTSLQAETLKQSGALTLSNAQLLLTKANTRNMSDSIALSFILPKRTPTQEDHAAIDGHGLETLQRWDNLITAERLVSPDLHREVTKGFVTVDAYIRLVVGIDSPNIGDIRRLSFQEITDTTGPLHAAFTLYLFKGDDRLVDLAPARGEPGGKLFTGHES